jgi:AsmA protein
MDFLQKRRKLLLVLGSILVALILVAAVLPFIIDVNRFRPQIEQQLQSALGRRVQIGNVHLALFSGGVSVENIAIGEDPAFGSDPFVSARRLDVGVQLLPLLFSNSMRIDSITLREPQVRLLRNGVGRWNFSTLGSTAATAKNRQPAGNQKTAPADVSIGSLRIVDGRVLVSSTPRAAPTTYEDVELHASNISFNSVMPFTVSAKTPGGGSIEVEGKAGPLNRSNSAETPLDAKISLDNVDLAATGFVDPASGLAGSLDFDGTVRSDGNIARTQGKVKAEKLRLVRGGTPARQPVAFDYATEYDLRRQSGTLTRGDVRTGSALAKLTGNYQAQGNATVLHMKMNAKDMALSELQGLLPAFGVVLPGGSSFQGGAVNADLAIDGPVDHIVTTGPLNISNARLTGFNLASKMATLSALTGMKTGGAETLIETFSSNLRVAPEGLRADNVNLVIPQIGTMVGSGVVGANNALDFKMLAKLAGGGGALGKLAALNTLGQSDSGIPFRIQGTTSNPIFVPDVAGVVGRKLAAPGGSNLTPKDAGGLLEGLFGKKKPKPQ